MLSDINSITHATPHTSKFNVENKMKKSAGKKTVLFPLVLKFSSEEDFFYRCTLLTSCLAQTSKQWLEDVLRFKREAFLLASSAELTVSFNNGTTTTSAGIKKHS